MRGFNIAFFCSFQWSEAWFGARMGGVGDGFCQGRLSMRRVIEHGYWSPLARDGFCAAGLLVGHVFVALVRVDRGGGRQTWCFLAYSGGGMHVSAPDGYCNKEGGRGVLKQTVG